MEKESYLIVENHKLKSVVGILIDNNYILYEDNKRYLINDYQTGLYILGGDTRIEAITKLDLEKERIEDIRTTALYDERVKEFEKIKKGGAR